MSNQQEDTAPSQVSTPFIDDGVAVILASQRPATTNSTEKEPIITDADMAAMSIQQVKQYLTTLIAREWRKSATCLYPSRNKVVASLMLSDNELAVCHVKFRCEDVPAHVVAKVRYLEKAENGFDFVKFIALLKSEARMVTFEDNVNSPKIDKYRGADGAVALLAELAIHAVQMDVDYVINSKDMSNKVTFKVALVCGRGYTYTYNFSIQLGARFAPTMRDLNRRFHRMVNPRCDNMVDRWEMHVQDLKDTGMGGHPKLKVVERLIQEHIDSPHLMFEEWMYVHEHSNSGEVIRGQEDFEKLLQWATGTIDHQPKGCLMRVMEAKMREIFVALKFLDDEQTRVMRNEIPPPPEPSPQSTDKDTSDTDDDPNMPWDQKDLKELGFESENDVSPTRRKSIERGQLGNFNYERPKQSFPRKQTIYR